MERKGLNLFRPYLSRFQNCGVSSIRIFDTSSLSWRSTMFSRPIENQKVNILTDAIGEGNEISKVIAIIGSNKISKICGYLGKISTLEKLKKEYRLITFEFANEVENSEYIQEHNKLQFVYQKRMGSLDEEHPQLLIKITPLIESDLLKTLVRAAVTDFYDGTINLKDDDEVSPNRVGFSLNFWNPKKVREHIPAIDPKLCEFDRVQMRFRFSTNSSCLRIMALSLTTFELEHKKFRFHRMIYGKCHQKLSNRLCSHIHFKSRLLSFIIKRTRVFSYTFCPHCIDIFSSNLIIGQFMPKFEKKLNENDYKMEIKKL